MVAQNCGATKLRMHWMTNLLSLVVYNHILIAFSLAINDFECDQIGIILCVHSAEERQRYIVASSLVGWAHIQNDPCHRCIVMATERHDDVIKWKHFPRNWPFVRGIHRSPVNSPHKGQWRGALMFYLICVWINGWVNNREAGDLRRYRAHYVVIVMR